MVRGVVRIWRRVNTNGITCTDLVIPDCIIRGRTMTGHLHCNIQTLMANVSVEAVRFGEEAHAAIKGQHGSFKESTEVLAAAG